MSPMVVNIIIWSLTAVLVVAFLAFARRDLAMLVRRPAANMGTGLGRIWAVARTCVFEALTARVWLVPLFWLAICLILCSFVRPFDETERIGLYVRILLLSQTFLVLLTCLILAVVSMPRDREKRIMITNASKPLSRLEIFLGKITGFCTVAALLLVAMTVGSYVFLSVADWQIKSKAAQLYALEERDYANAIANQTGNPVPPNESLKRVADEGALFAHNYISVPRGGMQIAGYVEFTEAGTKLYIKGGSQQRAIFQFGEGRRGMLATPEPQDSLYQTGADPFFFLRLGIRLPPGKQLTELPQFQLTVRPLAGTQRTQEKTVRMDERGIIQWAPDRPEEFTERGPVQLTVQCLTPDVLIEIPVDASGQNSQFGIGWVPARVQEPGKEIMQPALPVARIIGFEKREKQQIAGPDPKKSDAPILAARDQAIYRFSGESLRNVPVNSKGEFTLTMVLDIEKTANYTIDTMALVEVYNRDNPRERQYKVVPVVEKRATTVTLPANVLGDDKSRGDLYVHVSCNTAGHWLAFNEQSVRIAQPNTPFIVNLIKSELVIFFEAALLIIIGVTCSVRLGWAVAALTSIAAFVLGNFLEFIRSFLDVSGLSLFGYNMTTETSGFIRFVDAVIAVFFKFIYFLARFLPDFTQFDALRYIVESRNMPWMHLTGNIILAVIYALPFIAVGYLLIRKQELG